MRPECGKNHNLNFKKISRGVCFREFHTAGSCNRGNRCLFSHEIPERLRTDPWMQNDVEKAKKHAEKKRKEREQMKAEPHSSGNYQRNPNITPIINRRTMPRRNSMNNNNPVNQPAQQQTWGQSPIVNQQHPVPEYVAATQQQQSFLHLIRAMIQEQIPQYLGVHHTQHPLYHQQYPPIYQQSPAPTL